MKIIKKIIILIFTLVLTFGVYSFLIEPNILITKEYNMETNKNIKLKISHISDIHIKENYNEEKLDKIIEKINNENPDIVVFTGDLIDNYSEYGNKDIIIEKLSQIKSKYGKFSVWGNHDYGGGGYKVYEEIMEKSNFILLKNNVVKINIDDGKIIEIAGLDDWLLGGPDMKKIFDNIGDANYRILLSHEGDNIYNMEEFDLVLSGHSHGGQVNLPFIEKILPPLGRKYSKGLYDLGDTKIFLNSGIGTTMIKIRFRVVPEISILNLN